MSHPLVLAAGRATRLLFGAVLLAGCSSLTQVPDAGPVSRSQLASFTLDGRFSLNQGDTNYSGRLSWRHENVRNVLLISSPLGQGIAEISTDASGARLVTADGQQRFAANAELLTQEVLGYPLPITRLTEWVRGQRHADDRSEVDEHGRAIRLRHEGWSVNYGYASDDPDAPPDRIFAESAGGLKLRLRIDEWGGLPGGGQNP